MGVISNMAEPAAAAGNQAGNMANTLLMNHVNMVVGKATGAIGQAFKDNNKEA